VFNQLSKTEQGKSQTYDVMFISFRKKIKELEQYKERADTLTKQAAINDIEQARLRQSLKVLEQENQKLRSQIVNRLAHPWKYEVNWEKVKKG